jgi:tetratricopeptide (TPR) repeat protein
MVLNSLSIDIPPGDAGHIVESSFTTPVDVVVLGILPHAHYLAREMKGLATLPDGITRTLLYIPNWDFNWQGDYRFAEPVWLPSGTTLTMRYVYDNSTNNPVNPNHPPMRVEYGAKSSDEMAELWLQMLVPKPGDRTMLNKAYASKSQDVFRDMAERRLAKDPEDAEGHFTLGILATFRRNWRLAEQHLARAVKSKPEHQQAQFNLGVALLEENRLVEAKAAFEAALRLNPLDNRVAGSLGNVYLELGQIDKAAAMFEQALRLNPDDAIARGNLESIRKSAERGVVPLP